MRMPASAWLRLACLALLPACSDSSPETVEVHGQATTGSPLAGASALTGRNVFAFRIDRAGNPDGGAIARTTVDDAGSFTLNVPPTAFGDGVVVQVTASGSPSPVGPAGGNLNIPLIGTELRIDPAAELATRQIVEHIRLTPGTGLADFTVAESASFVGLDQTVLRNDPDLVKVGLTVDDTVDDTVTEIHSTQAEDVIEGVLTGLDDPNDEDVPVGTYRFVEYRAGFLENADRTSASGTLTINADKTVSVTSDVTRCVRVSGPGAAPCDRVFTTTTTTASVVETGTVTKGVNGFLLFTLRENVPGAEETTTLGSVTGDGSVIVFSVNSGGQTGMRVAVKNDDTLSVGPLNGEYGYASIRADFPPDGSATAVWPNLTSTLDAGVVGFPFPGPGLFGGMRDSQPMTQTVTCVAPVGCSLFAWIYGGHAPNPLSFGGTYTEDAAGGVSLTEGSTDTGRITQNGDVFVLQHLATTPVPSAGITVGTRLDPTSSQTVANLEGTWNFTQIEDQFGGPNALILGGVRTGVVTFDGIGNITSLVGGNSGYTHADCGEARTPLYDTFDSKGFVADLKPNGILTLTIFGFGPSFPLVGSLSRDGKVILLTHVRDIAPPAGTVVPPGLPPDPSIVSYRFFAVATRQ